MADKQHEVEVERHFVALIRHKTEVERRQVEDERHKLALIRHKSEDERQKKEPVRHQLSHKLLIAEVPLLHNCSR